MTKINKEVLHSFRCSCGKLLFKGFLLDSTIQIKCRKCGELMSFQGMQTTTAQESHFGMVFDERSHLISASSNIEKLFGYTISELLSKSYSELLLDGPAEQVGVGFRHLWTLPHKERYFFRSKTTLRHKDGSAIPGLIQSKFVIKKDSALLFSAFYTGDSYDALAEQPDSSLLREYPFFLQVSRDGICLDASMTRGQPHNRSRSEIVGRSFVSFMHASEAERASVLAQLRSGKYFQLLNKDFYREDGVPVRMNVFFTPNMDKNGVCLDYSALAINHESLERHEERFAMNSPL